MAAAAATSAGDAPRNCRRAGDAEITTGDTIRSTVVAHRTGTELPRTDSAARRAEILWPIARLAPGSSLAGKVAESPADLLAALDLAAAAAAAPE